MSLAVVVVLFLSLCSGCGSRASASGGGSGDSTYSGDNMFSYSFNGRKVTIRDIMHDGDDVTVTITDIHATHVAGTFSGKYVSGGDKPVPMEVTDGKFDLRFTKPEGS
jgi:hypothetical protein